MLLELKRVTTTAESVKEKYKGEEKIDTFERYSVTDCL